MIRDAIFLSYRRNETQYAAGRIYDSLVAAFGVEAIFKDIASIPPGEDFGAHITSALSRCGVLLVLIGPAWVDVRNADGARSLDDPNDWVRLEVETAFKVGLRVVSVMLNAPMPSASELPANMQRLAGLQAALVRDDPDFFGDMERLISALRTHGVPIASKGVSDIWDKTRHTRHVDELDQFIQTFDGTVEAFEARRRRTQLAAFLEIWAFADEFEHFADCEPFCGEGGQGGFRTNGEFSNYVLEHLEKIDEFLDKWHPSDLSEALLRLRPDVCRMARYLDEWEGIPDGSHVLLHEHERERCGKRAWSREMPKPRYRVPATLRPASPNSTD